MCESIGQRPRASKGVDGEGEEGEGEEGEGEGEISPV